MFRTNRRNRVKALSLFWAFVMLFSTALVFVPKTSVSAEITSHGEIVSNEISAGINEWGYTTGHALLEGGLQSLAASGVTVHSTMTYEGLMTELAKNPANDLQAIDQAVQNNEKVYILLFNGELSANNQMGIAHAGDWNLGTLAALSVDQGTIAALAAYCNDLYAKNNGASPVLITEGQLVEFIEKTMGPEAAEALKKAFDLQKNSVPVAASYPKVGEYDRHTNSVQHLGGSCIEYPPGPWEYLGTENKSDSVTGIHSTKLVLKPVVPVGFDNLSPEQQEEWRKTHVPQSSEPRTTMFGEIADAHNRKGTFESLRAGTKEAMRDWYSGLTSGDVDENIKTIDGISGAVSAREDEIVETISREVIQDLKNRADQGYEEGFLELVEQNLKGAARGGAWTITRYVKMMTVDFYNEMRQRQHYGCRLRRISAGSRTDAIGTVSTTVQESYTEYNKETGEYETKTRSVVKTGTHWHTTVFTKDVPTKYPTHIEGPVQDPASSSIRVSTSDWQVDRSLQFLTARCRTKSLTEMIKEINEEARRTAVSDQEGAAGSTNGSYNEGNVGKTIGGAYFMDKQDTTATVVSPVVIGSVANFFDGLPTDFYYNDGIECGDSTVCSPLPEQALSESDGRNNKINRDMIDNTFGAQSEGKTSRDFQYFRDGAERDIRVDVFAPIKLKGSSELNLPGKAERTIITEWPDGTPNDDNEYKISTNTGRTLFEGNRDKEVISGEVNKVRVSSTWASEKDKPNKYTFRYDYRPHITSFVPRVVTARGIYAGDYVSEDFNYVCYVEFDAIAGTPIIRFEPKYEDYPVLGFNDGAKDTHLVINHVKTSQE